MKKAVFKGYGLITLLLCAALFITAFDPAGACAEQTPLRTVRVGFYQVSRFQEGMSPAEEKSGYGYEYLQKVSYYSGWKYEYVCGSWTEIYDRFVKGDVDVMAGLSYAEEREDQMLFPRYEMGNESYYIYKHADDESIFRLPGS